MKNKHAFITGIAGFAGNYLVKELQEAGYQVSGSVYKDDSPYKIKELKKTCKIFKLDILSKSQTASLIKKINPDYIFHLAGGREQRPLPGLGSGTGGRSTAVLPRGQALFGRVGHPALQDRRALVLCPF